MAAEKELNIAEFREQLSLFFTSLIRLLELFPNTTGIDYHQTIGELEEQAMALSDSDLAKMYKTISPKVIWREFLSLVDYLSGKVPALLEETGSETNPPVLPVWSLTHSFPTRRSSDLDNLRIGVAAAHLATSLTQGVVSAIPPQIDNRTNPAHTAAVVTAAALDATAKSMAIMQVAEQREVNVKNEETRDNLIRLELEAALARGEVLVSMCLPRAVGGWLETVQTMVQKLLQGGADLGWDISVVQAHYDRAVAAISQKAYKQAMDGFVAAYQQLLCNVK